MAKIEACPGFQGNDEFYGLGIRISIYFQWFSAWITNTFEPDRVGSQHDQNSIFVLALLVAVAHAAPTRTIRPLEAYIMLLFVFGFFLSVLSLQGWRIWTSPPYRGTIPWMDALRDSDARERLERTPVFWTWRDRVRYLFFELPFHPTRWFVLAKHPTLSWAGYVWRTQIFTMAACLNIWLWYTTGRLYYLEEHETPCRYRMVRKRDVEAARAIAFFIMLAAVYHSIIAARILASFLVYVMSPFFAPPELRTYEREDGTVGRTETVGRLERVLRYFLFLSKGGDHQRTSSG